MKKSHLLFASALTVSALCLSGCQSKGKTGDEIWKNIMSSPRFTFAYPGTAIHDQSQVATLYPVNTNLSLVVDGKAPDYWRRDGAFPLLAGWRPIDVLPGEHEITVTFLEVHGAGASVAHSARPVTFKLDAKAGHFYRINYTRSGDGKWSVYVEEDIIDATKNNIVKGRNTIIHGPRRDFVTVPAGVSADKLERSILEVLASGDRTWIIDKHDPGMLRARCADASGSASIVIKYDAGRVDIYSKKIPRRWLAEITKPLARALGNKEQGKG